MLTLRKGQLTSFIEMTDCFQIRSLNDTDPSIMAAAFDRIGYLKPVAQFQRYLAEQAQGTRICLVATINGDFAGYVTVIGRPPTPDSRR